MRTLINNPLAVFDGLTAIPAAGIVIDGDRIDCVLGPDDDVPAVDYTLDASEKVITPGLVNCHHHYYQTLTRALPAALNKELFPWLQALYPIWAGLDGDAVSQSSELALAELMLSGCSLAADHHYVFNDGLRDAIDRQVEAASRLGVRVALTRGSMSLGEDDGGLPPQSVVQTDAEILADSERLVQRYHDEGEQAMVTISLAPCSPFSVTADLMRESARLARSLKVRLHTHLAETEDENSFCLERVNARPLAYLESLEWLGADVWFAHGIHFDADEITKLGRAGAGISHCPSSNMLLASGICKTRELEAAGCPVGLGVDGSASNDGSNMIQEVRQAFLLQRIRYGAANVSHEDALRWATSGGANVLGRPGLGRIHAGAPADLACFALDDLRFSGHGDPIAALVLCGAQQVDDLMIAGEWRVRGGEIPGLDLARLRARHGEAARRITHR